MELSFNNDSYFFKMEIQNGAWGTTTAVHPAINQDIISMSISEELGKLVSGSLTLRDPGHIYSILFRPGMTFLLSWGYKKWNYGIIATGLGNLTQALNGSKRQGITAIVSSPSGQSSENGEVTMTVNFYSDCLTKAKAWAVFTSGTKGSVIAQVMQQLGPVTPIIKFPAMTDLVTDDKPIRQWEGPIAFLNEYAKAWGCIFHTGYMPSGQKVAIFCTPGDLTSISGATFTNNVLGNTQNVKDFYYSYGDKSNVKSYSWQQQSQESAQGDNVTIQNIGGQTVFTRYKADTQSVVTYRINTTRMKDVLDKSPDKLKTAFSQGWLLATDFNDVAWGFDSVEEKTAPDGIGYTVNLQMIGDPMIIPGMTAAFRSVFPAPLNQTKAITPFNIISFIIRKVTHNISKSGYTTGVEVIDSYTLYGGYINPGVVNPILGT